MTDKNRVNENGSGVKRTLGLIGVTVNAMALIAPGAFLWITYQMQAAATAPNGVSVAGDIWSGILLALAVAFLTALSYAELAKIYPEAGFASCTYFAEKAWLDNRKEKSSTPISLARVSKIITGWSAHLYYWVYPGVMVAMMTTMISYIFTQFTGRQLSIPDLITICILFTITTGYIAYRGITGSTRTSLWINIIQLVTLLGFSGAAIWYRLDNPQHITHWVFSSAWDVLKIHSLNGMLIESTIAILILVGFESSTSLAAETKDPQKTIPKAIIIALIIQGLFAYLLEYFSANYMLSNKLTHTAGTTLVKGMAAAAVSIAPIGGLTKIIGNTLFNGIGFGLMISMAITVAIAIVGTTLSCMNTAMRVSAGMAENLELPRMMSYLHGRFKIPHITLVILIAVTAIIGIVGVRSVVGLTGITLASNLGTFTLYGLTCAWTIIAFKKRKEFNILKHGIIPVLGVIANLIMAIAILYLYIIGNPASQTEAKICFVIAGSWALVSLIYVGMNTVNKSYNLKMVSAMIRPEHVAIVAEALKEEDFIIGMTITKVKGFGRQLGSTEENKETDKILFNPKVRVDIVVKEWDVPRVMDIIREAAYTGNIGDGKIFVTDAYNAMRIRTGEKGFEAL